MSDTKKEAKKFVQVVEQKPTCPCCGSGDVYGISRVVGYYSRIDAWNKSKKAELKKRQRGNYWSDEQ